MKKTPWILLSISGFLILSGCGKMTQDPLSDKAQPVKDFTEKPTTPVGTPPVASDAVRIDTVDFYSFDESVAGDFQIGSRVLLPGYQSTVSIENLGEFPGASFANGKFSWTPSGVLTGGDLRTDKILQVKVIAQKTDAPVLVATKEIHIQITRQMHDPSIVSIQGPPDGIREGDQGYFTVQVRDEDAGSDPSTYPTVVMQNITGYQSFASYMTVQQKMQVSPGVFQFSYLVDFTGAELVKTTDTFKTNFQVFSHFGKMSQTQSATLKIKNLLSAPKSTWTSVVEVTAGNLLSYDFLIMDPKDEGYVDSVNFSNVPPGATATCDQAYRASTWSCHFTWQTSAKTGAGNFNFNAHVILKNSDSFDSQIQDQTFMQSIRVLPKPGPVPAEGVR